MVSAATQARLNARRQASQNASAATVGGWKSPTVAFAQANKIPITTPNLRTIAQGRNIGKSPGGYPLNTKAPSAPAKKSSGGSSGYRRSSGGGGGGGGGGRGGGGGGGGGPTGMGQAQWDWVNQMLGAGKPGQVTANTLDLPDYNATFDPSMYNELEAKLGQAVGQSRAGADTAYNNLGNYLTSNYQNAFAQGPPQGQAAGMDQASMQRMLQAQGVNPQVAAANQQGAAAGNAAFSNLWKILGGNEDRQQQNRLNRVQTDRGTTNMALDAAQLQGQTGIGLQRGQAQTAFNERTEAARNQIAQQEALANWQRQNEVTDVNSQNTNAYRNQQIQALLGLLPGLSKGVTMPNIATMFQ